MGKEKAALNIPAILKAEREYHEAKALVDSIDKMPAAMDKLNALDNEVKELRKEVQKFSKEVVSALGKLEEKLNSLNLSSAGAGVAQKAAGDAGKPAAAKPAPAAKKEEKDEDDIDLFGSDEEENDAEADKLRQERLAAYEQKKAKKPALIAKSMIILDVKPWDDETDVVEMEKSVRAIQADGLIWGTSKFVPVAYGIKKLQITCVVEDDKIGTDWLEEQITGNEDFVQSIDIVAFNKIWAICRFAVAEKNGMNDVTHMSTHFRVVWVRRRFPGRFEFMF